jgi:hypothetical protein
VDGVARLDGELAAGGPAHGVGETGGNPGAAKIDLKLDHAALAVDDLGVAELAKQIERLSHKPISGRWESPSAHA